MPRTRSAVKRTCSTSLTRITPRLPDNPSGLTTQGKPTSRATDATSAPGAQTPPSPRHRAPAPPPGSPAPGRWPTAGSGAGAPRRYRRPVADPAPPLLAITASALERVRDFRAAAPNPSDRVLSVEITGEANGEYVCAISLEP